MKFYQQVRGLNQVDISSPVAPYLVAAIIPSEGAGNTITEIVSGQSLDFVDGVTWNVDGSVTTKGADSSQNALSIANSRLIGKSSEVGDFAIIIDIDVGSLGGVGNANKVIASLTTPALGSKLTIEHQNWSTNLTGTNTRSWSAVTGGSSNLRKGVIIFHWTGTTNTLSIYEDGVKVTETVATDNNTGSAINNVAIGLGCSTDKLRSTAIYHKDTQFTESELNEFIHNPYSAFETAEVIEDEYCLQFSGANPTYVTANYAPSGDFKCLIEFTYEDSGHQVLLGMTGYDNVLRINSPTSILIKPQSNSSNVTLTTGLIIGQRYKWYFVRSGSTYDIQDIDGNSLLASIANNTSTFTFDRIGSFNIEGFFSGKLHAFGLEFNGVKRLWSFNQTDGDTVECVYTGDTLTLNGFPVDKGYVRSDSGVIDGYRFDNNTFATIKSPFSLADNSTLKCRFNYKHNALANTFQMLIGVYSSSSGLDFISISTTNHRLDCRIDNQRLSGQTVLVENQDYDLAIERSGTQISIRINGNLEMSWSNVTFDPILGFNTADSNFRFTGTIYSASYGIQDGTVINSWDFTTGDSNQIIERVSNNHASIVNIPTTKWLRVIDKQVYTIGSAKDYSTPQNFINGIGSNLNVINQGVVYEYFTNESLAKNGADGAIIELVGSTDKHAILEQKQYGFGGHCLINKSGLFSLKRLTLGSFSGNTNDGNLSIDSCVVDTASTQAINCSFIQKANISKTLFKSYTREAVVGKNTDNTKLQECIFDSSSVTSAVAFNVNNAELHNCLIPKGGCFAALGTVTGSGNVTDTVDAKNKGVGIQDASLPSYITDDGQINEAGQTALKGKGWNGSDIASAFYLINSGLVSVLSNLDVRTSTLGQVLSSVDIRQQILSALASITSSIDVRNAVYQSVLSNTDIRQQIYGIAVSQADLRSSVLSFVASNTDVRSSVYQAISSSYSIQQKILSAILSNTDIRAAILGSTVSKSVDIRQAVLGATVAQSVNLVSQVLAAVSHDSEVVNSVLGTINATSDIRASVYHAIDKSTDIQASIYQALSKELDIRQQVYRVVASDLDTGTKILSSVSNIVDIRMFVDGVAIPVDLDKPVSFSVGETINSIDTTEQRFTLDVISERFSI
ncbi:hypothetical protein J7384_17060 [Endozoicomonas sp. G2_1]|uniref:hypothetical protein n=1 Tax=Endozoicomonas sp. G2_1 TaxID=2821091 RepID=UPI001ADAE7B4|nr:hypothetical protein [Endozoicomonas sp. G2_1]MBO9492074.1 hypothetical protein [Endozoicomonas sp. G2_1]